MSSVYFLTRLYGLCFLDFLERSMVEGDTEVITNSSAGVIEQLQNGKSKVLTIKDESNEDSRYVFILFLGVIYKGIT